MRSTTPATSSAVRLGTPVRTRAAPPETSPAGSAAASSRTARAISSMVTSWRRRSAEVTSTRISGAAKPRIEVRVTPSAKSLSESSSA